jgi:hypothetical protein
VTDPLWTLRLFAKWLVKKLHLAGVVGLIEYCDDCGIRQPLVWYAADELWLAVTGDVGGVLCPECFDRRARGNLHGLIRWTPTLELFKEA